MTNKNEQDAIDFLYKHGDLTYSWSQKAIKLLSGNGFSIVRKVAVDDEIARVVQSVNDWDDRTSPDDYPDHLLITSEELTLILRNFAATLEGSNA